MQIHRTDQDRPASSEGAAHDVQDVGLCLVGLTEVNALAAGQPFVVAVPGRRELDSLPLVIRQPERGVLRRVGALNEPALPLPSAFRPLVMRAPDANAAAGLAVGLPMGVAAVVGANPVPALPSQPAQLLKAS